MTGSKQYFSGKHITLMGLGLLGRGVGDARFLAECGAILRITDLKTEAQLQSSVAALKEFPDITFHLGGHRLEDFEHADYVLKAAGVPLDSPYIAHARKNGIPVRMSADLFAELSGIPIVGITGTRGKSTTTHLLAHILASAGKKVLLGGNVRGVSTLSLLSQVTDDAIGVLELDSWQLQGFGEAKISPHVAIFTTFLPDHMNYYKNDMALYFADKANIFLSQTESDTFVVGEQVTPFLTKYGYRARIHAKTIVVNEQTLPKNIHLVIPGEHNRYNAALAVAAARALDVEEAVIAEAARSFMGVPGRLQKIADIRGVSFYNDTTATVPEATLAALHALGDIQKRNLILIMGGSEKGLDMNTLLNEIPTVCKGVLLLAGAGTERIKAQLPDASVYNDMASAVHDAFGQSSPGDIILMSPAFASFGMFTNEFDRGEQFEKAVNSLQ